MKPESTSPGGEQEIGQLLTLGKCKQAVELAKENHKRLGTAGSQSLLVKVYAARIEQFHSKGMPKEAQALLNLVQERFPTERHQLAGSQIRAAAASGGLHELLSPLVSPHLAPETKTAIENAIAKHVTDLASLATCDALPAEHMLRTGAAVVWRAFTAVVGGPVAEAEISLPEISHRSPFAAWKMLIRAIAAFYRLDDDSARRALDAIPADSAVAPGALALRAMVDAKKPSAGIAGVLYGRIVPDDQPLRSALEKIDGAFEYLDESQLLSGIREMIRRCPASQTELLERLKQNVIVRCLNENAPILGVVRVLGTIRKNAYFWRLAARSTEAYRTIAQSAFSWERFLRHAVHEGMFAESSAEAAVIWLHIADLLFPFSLHELELARREMVDRRGMSSHYDDQPEEIALLRPASDRQLADDVIGPGSAYRHAARIQPDAETYAKWWAWADNIGLPDKHMEDIALDWSRARRGDVQPLLHLSMLAESRNALSMAIKWLGQAEAIDPMNMKVRSARFRLTLSITWRHCSDRKPHLVEKDIAELAALPGMNEGDRWAVLESIRTVWHRLSGNHELADASHQLVLQKMGPLAGTVLFCSIEKSAGQHAKDGTISIPNNVDSVEVAQAMARVIRIAEDLKLSIVHPLSWTPQIIQVLGQRPCPLSIAELMSIGRFGIVIGEQTMAYLASAAGLMQSDKAATTGRLLLLRAKSLDQHRHSARRVQCLRAALDLARQGHDEGLIDEVFATIDADINIRRSFTHSRDGQGLSGEVLQQVLESERKAGAMPVDKFGVDPHTVEAARFASFRRPLELDVDMPGSGWGDEDDEDDDADNDEADFEDEDDDDDGALFDAGPRGGISDKDLSRLAENLLGGEKDSLEKLQKNPSLLIDAMAKLLGMKVNDAEKRAIADEFRETINNPDSALPGGPFSGGRSKKNKKNRR